MILRQLIIEHIAKEKNNKIFMSDLLWEFEDYTTTESKSTVLNLICDGILETTIDCMLRLK